MGLKHLSGAVGMAAALIAGVALPRFASAAVDLELDVTAYTSGLIESDWTAVFYSESHPLLITNDGAPATGGFHVWDIDGDSPLEPSTSLWTGRTKLVATVYDVGGKDYLVSIPQTTSVLSLYEFPGVAQVEDASFSALGDWSAMCSWRSPSANNYLFIFGKHQAIQLLIRENAGSVEIVEIQTFDVPIEFAGCAVSLTHSKLLLTPDDGDELFYFDLAESTEAPEISVHDKADDDITGVAVYHSAGSNSSDYLFVALEDVIHVYEYPWTHLGTLELTGLQDIEVEAPSLYQAATSQYPSGVLAYAAEADDFEGFAFSSLDHVLEELGIEANTDFDPRTGVGRRKHSPIDEQCSFSGFFDESSETCHCFAGSDGDSCEEITCTNDCSGHGTCVRPNLCECDEHWGGLHCSFLLVEPDHETEPTGDDGDDPAIWISPDSPDKSLIVTTTKSEAGAGLSVFDLQGRLLQNMPAGQPNNVDMIYGFQAGNRTVDLAFAACREDDTLCLFEMTPDGILKDIPGGSQPSHVESAVYGSCVYRSRKTGKQYLFVNEKSARYLQYELTSFPNGTLHTELVRDFVGGTGGQVEGCVTDEDNGWLFLGEEPSALWRYDAEPDGGNELEDAFLVAHVDDGQTWGDVEGVTLVQGKTEDQGYILVSCQGVSAYNVYERAEPHEYVMTFTVTDSADGLIDHVSNTDGLAAVGVNLGPTFPRGLVVVHDDTNELPEGGAHEEASYKIIALDKILAAEPLEGLGLLDGVDPEWDPRA